MYNFICFAGPGVFTWLIQKQILREGWKSRSVFRYIAEIIGYAVINMALVVTVLRPIGRVQVQSLDNGRICVQYGTTALLISVFFSVILGWLGVVLVTGKIGVLVRCRLRKKEKTAIYTAALLMSIGIIVFHAGSPDTSMSLNISTVPMKINDVFYHADVPIYLSSESEYFISFSELAKGLGVDCGIRNVRIFQREYYLGDDVFTVNYLSPGKNFYIKDGELFVNLTYLKDGEPFMDIRVVDTPYLDDGSLREMIHIHNYPCAFDYKWIENVSVVGVQEDFLSVFKKCYPKGIRVFEAETDTLNAARDILKLMTKNPDIYIVITKVSDLQMLVNAAETEDSDVLSQIIPQVGSGEMYETAMDMYDWKSMIYSVCGTEDFSEKDVVRFAYSHGIQVIVMDSDRPQDLFFKDLFEHGIHVYWKSVNSVLSVSELKTRGVHGIFTDALLPVGMSGELSLLELED